MARWVHRRDRGKQLELIPFQEPDLEERFAGISRERCREELHLIDERDHIFTGAAAVRETVARLPGTFLRTLPFHTPGGTWLTNRIYRWVARNRGWLSHWFS
ncbi:MAG: thiol-disulfide oxidoreductase DCC family protein [Candidatus Methylomirabilales bacterium]